MERKTSQHKHFRVFGSRCYIRREDRTGKFDSKVDEGIFLGYSSTRKAYKCFNLKLNRIVESINVKIDEISQEQDKTRKGEFLRDETTGS